MNEHKETLDFSLSMSHTHTPTHTPLFWPLHPFFFTPVKKTLFTLHLVFYIHDNENNDVLNTMPAEPGALIKSMTTQICTFCQSGGSGGAGFPKTQTKFQNNNLSNRLFRSGLKKKINFFFSYYYWKKKPVDDKWCFFCPGKCFKAILGHSWGYCS